MNWSISATPERRSLGVCQDKLVRILRTVHCSKVMVTLHQTGRWEEELLFSRVKSHLPEVTIKTHLSARANAFIPASTREDFTCSFAVSWPSLESEVQSVAPRLQQSLSFWADFKQLQCCSGGALPLKLELLPPPELQMIIRLKVHFGVTRVWHQPISQTDRSLSLGRPLCYAELYQM